MNAGRAALLGAAALALAACSKTPPAPPPMTVTYAVATQQNTPLYREYVGQIQAQNDVAIRPLVGGIVISRSFVEGGFVRKGQALYVIDPREYREALALELRRARQRRRTS